MQPTTPAMEMLEDRLCLSATHHHLFTGVRPHVVAAISGHTRHHFHTGVRVRGAVINPPAILGQLPTIQTTTPINPTLPTMGNGLFGSGGGLFGGGGSIFA